MTPDPVNGRLVVRTAGLADRQGSYTVTDGEIRFQLDGKEFSYIQERETARAAVRAFSD